MIPLLRFLPTLFFSPDLTIATSCTLIFLNLFSTHKTKAFNFAARLVSHTPKFSHLTISCRSSLATSSLSLFKICFLMYKISHSTWPSYLSNLLLPPKPAGLRSLLVLNSSFYLSLTLILNLLFLFMVHFSGTLFLLILHLLLILLF